MVATHTDFVTLSKCSHLFPSVNGRHPAISTVNLWATRGCRGQILETRRFGGRIVTTPAAIERFVEAISK